MGLLAELGEAAGRDRLLLLLARSPLAGLSALPPTRTGLGVDVTGTPVRAVAVVLPGLGGGCPRAARESDQRVALVLGGPGAVSPAAAVVEVVLAAAEALALEAEGRPDWVGVGGVDLSGGFQNCGKETPGPSTRSLPVSAALFCGAPGSEESKEAAAPAAPTPEAAAVAATAVVVGCGDRGGPAPMPSPMAAAVEVAAVAAVTVAGLAGVACGTSGSGGSSLLSPAEGGDLDCRRRPDGASESPA